MSQTAYSYTQGKAFAGLLADTFESDILSFNQAESSSEIPFGVMMMKGTADRDAKLINSVNAVPIGILVHSYNYSTGTNGELGTVGVKPKNTLNVLNKGRIWVLTEENVTAYDRAYTRIASGAGGTQLGAFRKTAVAGETYDITPNARFLTSASAGGLAVLEIDMTPYLSATIATALSGFLGSVQYVSNKTLVAGDVTVSSGVTLTANSVVFPIRNVSGGTPGLLTITNKVVGGPGVGGFHIHSASNTDTSVCDAVIIG